MNRLFLIGPLAIVLLCGCNNAPQAAPPQSVDDEASAAAGTQETSGGQASAESAPISYPQLAHAPADSGPGEDGSDAAEVERVEAGMIRLAAPKGWTRKKPSSGFVAAEFALPRAEGDERDGRLTVSMAGGTVEANVARWKSQFGGKPDHESEKKLDIAGVTATVVDFAGTYNDARGPFAPGVKRKGYRMLGAIIPAGERLHFVKAYGPEKTMEKHHQAFQAFLKTLKVDGR